MELLLLPELEVYIVLNSSSFSFQIKPIFVLFPRDPIKPIFDVGAFPSWLLPNKISGSSNFISFDVIAFNSPLIVKLPWINTSSPTLNLFLTITLPSVFKVAVWKSE